MVGWVAGPVKNRAVFGLQTVGIAGLGQIGQSPVNSGQPDGTAVILEGQMQLLGAYEALGFTEGMPDGVFLTGISALWFSHFA